MKKNFFGIGAGTLLTAALCFVAAMVLWIFVKYMNL